MVIIVGTDLNWFIDSPLVCMCWIPHPQEHVNDVGLCMEITDETPAMFCGCLDMCHRVRVKSRRPNDFCSGVTNWRKVVPRIAAFKILFIVSGVGGCGIW